MPAPFNEALIVQRLGEIEEARDLLKPYAEQPVEQFVANREAVDAAKYRLLMGIEACAHLCSHLMSRLAGRAPDSMSACFEYLAEQGIIATDLARSLVQMARFRNLLVHRYQIVDNRQVHQIIRESVRDWDSFMQSVREYLQE